MTDKDAQGLDPQEIDAPASAATQSTSAPAEPAKPDGDASDTGADPGSAPGADFDADDSSSRRKGVGKRIDELTRNWRETERDRDYWREVALRAGAVPQKQPAQPEPADSASDAPDATPKGLADFGYDEAAYTRYVVEQAGKLARQQAREEFERSQAETEERERRRSLSERERAFAREHEDYFEVTRARNLAITQTMVDALVDSDESAAVLYYLGKNPQVAERLAELSPWATARELGRIEARLVAERKRAQEEKKKASSAPPPPPRLDAEGPATEKARDEMSMDEWMALRRKELKKARQRT